MAIFLIILAIILALPFLVIFGFLHIVTESFEAFGLPPGVVIAILLAMLVGSVANIPLGRRRLVETQDVRFFGLIRQKRYMPQGLSINVGGALIPLFLALYLLQFAPLKETLTACAIMIVICFALARFMPGKGIGLPTLLPALFATLIALILAGDQAAPVAFVSGVFGVIIGADLLHLPRVMRQGQGVMSIGGAGVFDGIFIIAIVAAFLAGL
ncbi:MAG TPA: DUF1614 domain-containing protein [Candidatus Paceibacterota bacterium]|nr:DUF1614 domain-containing protein [Candidatus Paceibacterota bacterium]